MNEVVRHEVDRRETALAKKRPEYIQAKALLDALDFKPAMDLIFSYHKGDSPESAVFILAQCQVLLKVHRELVSKVAYFERETESLKKLIET